MCAAATMLSTHPEKKRKDANLKTKIFALSTKCFRKYKNFIQTKIFTFMSPLSHVLNTKFEIPAS